MTELKCPFCDKPLQPTHRIEDEYFCEGYDCPQTSLTWIGTSSLWKALANTKKKLDIAVDGITYMRNNCLNYAADYMDYADGILEQINNKEDK